MIVVVLLEFLPVCSSSGCNILSFFFFFFFFLFFSFLVVFLCDVVRVGRYEEWLVLLGLGGTKSVRYCEGREA